MMFLLGNSIGPREGEGKSAFKVLGEEESDRPIQREDYGCGLPVRKIAE